MILLTREGCTFQCTHTCRGIHTHTHTHTHIHTHTHTHPQATINQQKRKISRQRDILSNLKGRYLETDRK